MCRATRSSVSPACSAERTMLANWANGSQTTPSLCGRTERERRSEQPRRREICAIALGPQLRPHERGRHVAESGGRVEPAVGPGDDAMRVAEGGGHTLESV